MEIKAYQASDFDLWNQYISDAPNSTFLFHRSFMEYHQDRFQDASLLVFDERQLIAVLPANFNLTSKTVYSHQGLTYGGLIFKTNLSKQKQQQVFQYLYLYLKKKGFKALIYKELPFFYQTDSSYLSFQGLAENQADLVLEQAASVIDLQAKKAYQTRRKRMMKKARAAAVNIQFSTDLAAYWDLLATNLAKRYQTQPVHTLSEMKLLANRFPNQIKLCIAQVEGELLGGILLFITKQTVKAQYIAANEAGKSLGALDLLVDWLIDAFKPSHQFLSLGTSSSHTDGSVNQGVKDWKDGFGAVDMMHQIYQLTL